jgi:hypothetical protein
MRMFKVKKGKGRDSYKPLRFEDCKMKWQIIFRKKLKNPK